MGLPNLTPEEEYLLKKFALLKKKVNLWFLAVVKIYSLLFPTTLDLLASVRIFCLVIIEEGASKVERKD